MLRAVSFMALNYPSFFRLFDPGFRLQAECYKLEAWSMKLFALNERGLFPKRIHSAQGLFRASHFVHGLHHFAHIGKLFE
jgi:hypothetical protein